MTENERKYHLRLMNGECLRCGTKLHPVEDLDFFTGNMRRHCIMCRIKRKYKNKLNEAQKRELYARCAESREERRRAMHMCLGCGRPLPNEADYERCSVCELKLQKGEGAAVKVDPGKIMARGCEHCEWKIFHGDNWSCPSPYGTDPRRKNCLRYEHQRLKEIYGDE